MSDVPFDVAIPSDHVRSLAKPTFDRFMSHVGHPIGRWTSGYYPEERVLRFHGSAPRHVVTLTMALAQGHPLEPILDRLDSTPARAPEEDT